MNKAESQGVLVMAVIFVSVLNLENVLSFIISKPYFQNDLRTINTRISPSNQRAAFIIFTRTNAHCPLVDILLRKQKINVWRCDYNKLLCELFDSTKGLLELKLLICYVHLFTINSFAALKKKKKKKLICAK